MPGFEKRITDEQVAIARRRIAEGATLRAAAAEIPCAASTLSYRIKRAEQAEAATQEEAGDDARSQETVVSPGGASAGGERAGPLEILREALQAIKPSGQPDWATRISAARTLATLRPQELEPKEPQVIPAQITVHDLEPGAHPVLHRPVKTDPTAEEDEPLSRDEGAADGEPPSSNPRSYYYHRPDGEGGLTLIGSWSPAHTEVPTDPKAGTVYLVATAKDLDTAERWRAELTAGRLPQTTDKS